MEADGRSHYRRHHRGTQQNSPDASRRHPSKQRPAFPVIPQADDDKDGFVLGWLSQLREQRSGSSGDGTQNHYSGGNEFQSRRQTQALPERWAPHGLSLPTTFHHSRSIARPSPQSKRRKKRGGSIEDSSIIGASPRYQSTLFRPDHIQHHRQTRPDDEDYSHIRQKRKRPVSDDGSEPSILSAPDANFEKRARHKTRSDRYDVYKHEGGNKDKKAKTKKSPKERKKRKREQMTSATEVMGNFQSDSILHERITMPPYLRPGLFDNGKESKKQHLTDLTFHEMSFLKQPRPEHHISVPRKRDAEKRRERSERELEEISAFFLQKDVPDRFDAQGRKRPRVSGLSSLGESTVDISAYGKGHQKPRTYSRTEVSRDHKRLENHGSEQDSQRSRANTYITWSLSPPDRNQQAQSRERQRSSTPANIKDALVRSGIFDNTGILPDEIPICKSLEGAGKRPSTQTPKPQSVRIVRYQDRGTEARDEIALQETHSVHEKRASIRHAHQEPNMSTAASKSTAMQTDVALTDKSNAEPLTACSNPPEDGTKKLGSHHADDGRTNIEPSRPMAPRSTLVSKLEAITDRLVLDGLAEPALSASHVDRQPCEPISSHNQQQRPAPTPILGPSFTPNHRPEPENLPWPVPASWYSAGVSRSPVMGFPAPSFVPPNSATTTTTHSERFGYPIAQANLALGDSFPPLGHPAPHSMHDYIMQLEQEVLDRPQEHGYDERYEFSEYIGADGARAAYLGEQVDAYQDGAGEHLQPYVDAVDRNSEWRHVEAFEEDEEQKFVSSFWRPNRYPI